ncbi:MAG: DUF4290 domain-containing protein [Bacteroidales bacterium]|nr:DUF4290 domain-containing protein [Bacteroidales bacterium]
MDYNTSRKKLSLPEYGRNIQKMVDYIVSIKDKEERNDLAKAIIQIMGNMNPHLRDISDFKHKLWDHLAIMSDFKLDIDYPYDLPARETFTSKPRPVDYNINEIRYKHYGRVIELLIERAVEMPESEEKEALIQVIANHMKKSYLTWNKDSVDDWVIFKDLKELSKSKISIDEEDLKLSETKEILAKSKRKRLIRPKK